MPLLAAPPTTRRPAALARPTGEDDEWSYDWNESDRLVAVEFQSVAASTLVEDYRVEFAYDASGRRILKRGKDDDDNARTRYFFHGITEEIVKQSVDGAHSDAAFDRLVLFTGEDLQGEGWEHQSELDVVLDTARRSEVYECTGDAHNGQTLDSGYSWDITGYRTFSAWLKGDAGSYFTIYVETDDTTEPIRGLRYKAEAGSPYGTGVMSVFPVGGTHQDFASELWTRVERNLESDLEARWPGLGLVGVVGMDMSAGSTGDVRMDDLALGNGVTVVSNTVVRGEDIAEVVRQRVVNVVTSSADDQFLAYDHVGTLYAYLSESSSTDQRVFHDAWGKATEGPTGTWKNSDGLTLNSRSSDGATQLIYMDQRWYSADLGLFASAAPYDPVVEHPYGFAEGHPTVAIDPDGRTSRWPTWIERANGTRRYIGRQSAAWVVKNFGSNPVWRGPIDQAVEAAKKVWGDKNVVIHRPHPGDPNSLMVHVQPKHRGGQQGHVYVDDADAKREFTRVKNLKAKQAKRRARIPKITGGGAVGLLLPPVTLGSATIVTAATYAEGISEGIDGYGAHFQTGAPAPGGAATVAQAINDPVILDLLGYDPYIR